MPRVLKIIALVAIAAGFWNATLYGDDLYMVAYFEKLRNAHSSLYAIESLFFCYDIGGAEYRTYGLSRVIHFVLWLVFGNSVWAYGTIIASTQALSGLLLFKLLRRMDVNEQTATPLAAIWILSAFATTTCFHFYSYLILPYQILILLCFFIERKAVAGLLAIAIVLTGESHLLASAMAICIVAWHRKRASFAILPLAIMAITLAGHRYGWTQMFPSEARPRFDFAIRSDLVSRLVLFFQSILNTLIAQIQYSFEYALPVGAIIGSAVALSGLVTRPRCAWRVPCALLLITLASLAVIGLGTILSGQGGAFIPRRYGYVPFTLIVMTVYSASSSVDMKAANFAANLVLCLSVSCWVTLQFFVLPKIRSEDAVVFSVIRSAIKDSPYLLFPNKQMTYSTPGIRRTFPADLIETPLSLAPFVSLYSINVLGAKAAAQDIKRDTDGIRLLSYPFGDITLVPEDRIWVIDPATPPDWKATPLITIRHLLPSD